MTDQTASLNSKILSAIFDASNQMRFDLVQSLLLTLGEAIDRQHCRAVDRDDDIQILARIYGRLHILMSTYAAKTQLRAA